jgi:hypothetical protein
VASRLSLAVLAAAGPILLAASFSATAPALWAGAVAVAFLPVAFLSLSLGLGRPALVAVAAALGGGWAVLLAFPHGGSILSWAFGLPLGTAVMLFVMVPVPFAALAWASVRSGVRGLDSESLARLRRIAAAMPVDPAAPVGPMPGGKR